AAAMKSERGASRTADRAERRARRHLVRVDGLIDLIAGSDDVVPVRERVAAEEPHALGELKLQVDADLGDDAEDVAGERTAVAADGGEARGDGSDRLRVDAGEAVDRHRFVGDAERDLAEHFERPAIAFEVGAKTELAAVEVVARIEAIHDDDGVA